MKYRLIHRAEGHSGSLDETLLMCPRLEIVQDVYLVSGRRRVAGASWLDDCQRRLVGKSAVKKSGELQGQYESIAKSCVDVCMIIKIQTLVDAELILTSARDPLTVVNSREQWNMAVAPGFFKNWRQSTNNNYNLIF